MIGDDVGPVRTIRPSTPGAGRKIGEAQLVETVDLPDTGRDLPGAWQDGEIAIGQALQPELGRTKPERLALRITRPGRQKDRLPVNEGIIAIRDDDIAGEHIADRHIPGPQDSRDTIGDLDRIRASRHKADATVALEIERRELGVRHAHNLIGHTRAVRGSTAHVAHVQRGDPRSRDYVADLIGQWSGRYCGIRNGEFNRDAVIGAHRAETIQGQRQKERQQD